MIYNFPILAVFGIDDVIWFLIYVAITVGISYGIAALTAKKPKSPDGPPPGTLDIPTVAEGASFPVIFGMPKRLEGYLIAWWGDIKVHEVATRKSGQHITLGYDYLVGMHILLCHGPIDGVKQIYVGDELAWPNHDDKTELASDNTATLTIDQPNLFGGNKKEGGVEGDIDIQYGGSSQTPNTYLAQKMSPCSGALVGTHSTSDTTISIDGLPANREFLAGDSFVIAGNSQVYTITEDATANGSGAVTLTVTPGLVQNYSNNAKVTFSIDISASRGLVGVILKQVNTGMSPYPKPWSFLVKRTGVLDDGSTQWYSAKADISGDMNPVHIIRECMTNNRWGLKHSTGMFDDTVWQAAADTLYTEGFGLSATWDGSKEIEEFIADILKHINAILYQQHSDGKFVLKLIRDDYDIDDLDTYDDATIASVEDFTRGSYGLIPDVVNVKFFDIYKNETASVSVHDIAVMDVQGGRSIPLDADYRYVTKAALASKIAARERHQATAFPATMTIKGNRAMSSIHPGSVFILKWPILGIDQMVIRVVEANYGSLQDGIVTLKCIEDIFSTQSAIYSTPPDTGWISPISNPSASPANLLIETPFYDIVQKNGVSIASSLNSDAGYMTVSAKRPTDDAFAYELLVRDSLTGAFASVGQNGFTPNGLLTANLLLNADDAEIELSEADNLDAVQIGDYAVIGDEFVLVKDVDAANDTVTIARGVLDTVPVEHTAGDMIWFVGSMSAFYNREYVDGDQPGVKILPITAKGTFAEASATAVNASALDSRAARPYAPGNVKINNVSYPASFSGAPTITWTHRDRTQQTSAIVEHSAASIGPESGTTYTLKIYGDGGTLKRTVTGITAATYTYLDADEKADNGGNLNSSLRFELWSVRDGLDSWQKYDITVNRA